MTRIKNINTRIQLKNDTETNWNKAKAEEGKDGFIPLLGEAIVYMGDNNHGPRLKIGDGVTNVTDLPFLEDKDTVYTASNGIKITAENIIQHINYLDAFPSEIGFYKIKYDQNGHINGATAVSKQDIINLLEITPGRIDSVQITAEAPLVSSNSTENTTSLITNISFNTQEKNTVLAGPSNAASGSPSFRLLVEDDIPNLSASKITGTFSADQIGNLPASKINSGTFHEDRIPNLGYNKISGVIPVSKGGTGIDGINGDSEHNVRAFTDNGIFAYDAINTRFKQFQITAPGNTDTFTNYVNSLNGDTENRIVDLNTLIKAVPPINLNNPRDITQNYTNSYYAPKTKGWKNSVLISQGGENLNEGTEPIWLNPTALSAEGFHGGALFYGRYSREVERIVNDETVTSTETGFETQWGTLPVEQGGTGVTNFNNDYVLIGSGENPIRTIQKTSSLISNTIVERDTNGDFATRSITLSQNLLCNNINENFKDNKIISIDSSNKLATFFGNVNANNLTAFIGELKMSKTNSETIDQPSIKWYKGNSIKTENAITSQINTLIGELYWDHNNSNRGMLRNYYLANNAETYSDSYYLPETDTSSANNNIFTLLATEDSISNMFPSNSILYSNGKVNKITYKNSADGALYSTSTNGNLEWGTLPVAQGGTGLTTSGTVNAVIIGNSVESYKTRAFQTVSTNSGAFYATGINNKPEFGTLPIEQGGTGVTSIADIQAGKDGDGNTISSTYLKLSGGTMTGPLKWTGETALSAASSLQYFLGIDAFTNDGTTHYITAANLLTSIGAVSTSAVIDVLHGGTGATTAAGARTNLEITPANIGAVNKDGDTIDGTLIFANYSDEGFFCNIDYKNISFYKFSSSTSSEIPIISLYDNVAKNKVRISSADGIEIYGPVPGTSYMKLAYLNGDGLFVYYPAQTRANLDVPSTTGSGASGTWGISITGSAGSVAAGNISGTVAVGKGGTGATTAADARTNLNVPSKTGSGASGTWEIGISGNAATATKFASSQSITLTGDTTGTVSSQAGWSITTKTDKISPVGDNRTAATKPDDYNEKIIFQGLKTNGYINNPSFDTYSYVIGLRAWGDSSGGKAHEFAFNNGGINHRIGSTTSWENWEKIITSGNYTDYITARNIGPMSNYYYDNNTEHSIGKFKNYTLYRKEFTQGSYSDNAQVDFGTINGTVIRVYGIYTQNDGSRVAANHYYDSTSYSSLWVGSGNYLSGKAHPGGTSMKVFVEYYR